MKGSVCELGVMTEHNKVHLVIFAMTRRVPSPEISS